MTVTKSLAADEAAPVPEYSTPLLTIPYAWNKPQMDGVVNHAEWRGAFSINALQTTNKQVSQRQARFWLMWDEDNLYLAMRSPLRPGERVIQAMRERSKDFNVVFDDSYELYVDAGTQSPDGQPVFFQFLSNFAGARWDVMHEPAVGNFRLGWASGWEPKNRITAGNEWEMEVVIPRTSIYKQSTFKDGDTLRGLLARNFKRPWEQNSVEGTGSFSVRDTYSRWVLRKDAPAIHLLDVANTEAKTFGVHLAAQGHPRSQGDSALRWIFESDSGESRQGILQVIAGELSTTDALLKLATPGPAAKPGRFRLRVLSADGQTTLLDWSALQQFGMQQIEPKLADRGDAVALQLQLNPVHNYLRITGDFINYDAREQITRAEVEVKDSAGKSLAKRDLSLDELSYVRGVMPLPRLPRGEYSATLTALDANGKKVLALERSFQKKEHTEFPWWNTSLGNIEKVIAPWTPVEYSQGRFDVWGRGMRAGHAGLPQQVATQNHTLLARPVHLVARLRGGRVLVSQPAKLTLVSSQPHRAVIDAESTLDDIRVRSRITVEFDGMYKVEMTLDPARATEIESLRVVVPFRNEVADYLHACGEGIRSGYYYGHLPKSKQGRLWDSRQVDGQPMLVGSFIPYLWIGNPRGGIAWFADSDEGWMPTNDIPAIEVRRDTEASTDLVLNLVGGEAGSTHTLDKPREVTFAFQATPVKPLHEGWRMDSWWTGDTFRDFAAVEKKGGHLIFTSIPFTLDAVHTRQMVEAQHKSTNSFIFGVNKYRANAVPYFEHIRIGERFVPEMEYFGDEWKTRVSEGLSYGKTLTDFFIYNLSNWAKETGIDGFYIDNMHPLADDNIEAGRGYRLPDGRVQPTFQMFETRQYFLRMRAAFAEQGKRNKIVLHMTNNMIVPWVGAADIALDGEHHVIYPEMNKDFMDFWSLERMRVDYPHQWGVAVNFLQEYQGNWRPDRLAKAMRAYTGMMLLHDVLASSNANGLNTPAWIARDRFGIEATDVRFIPYWQPESGVSTPAKNVYLAAWKRPGKVLLAVVNTGEAATAMVTVDSAKLELPPASRWKVWDAEEGTVINQSFAHREVAEHKGAWNAANQKPIEHRGDGTISVPIERHDYRHIIIEAQP